MNSYLEAKITVNQIALLVIGCLIAISFTVGAFKTGQWAWLVAVPLNLVGMALVLLGGVVRRRTQGSRGTAVSALGALFIAGSIWAAFMLGNAISG